jgi:hypoxia up-regulated 1
MMPTCVTSRAILGVDLGSLYMKVALVQSGSPLEIVTNLHSQRKTEQMVLFESPKNNNKKKEQDASSQQRFYGADAASLLARKSHLTPAAMSVLLGRDDEHPVVQVRTNYIFDVDFIRICGHLLFTATTASTTTTLRKNMQQFIE